MAQDTRQVQAMRQATPPSGGPITVEKLRTVSNLLAGTELGRKEGLQVQPFEAPAGKGDDDEKGAAECADRTRE